MSIAKRLAPLCGLGLFLASAGSAQATLIGDIIDCQHDFLISGVPVETQTGTALVGPGRECSLPAGFGDADTHYVDLYEDNGMSFLTVGFESAFVNLVLDFEWTLTDLDWVDDPTGEIVGLELVENNFVDAFGGVVGVSATSAAHSIEVSVDSFVTDVTEYTATWKILTAHATHVSEPHTAALLGLALVAVAAGRKKA